MTNPTEIVPGLIFYSYLTNHRKEKVSFMANNSLVLLVSGRMELETSRQKVSVKKGEMLLIGKNQLAQITKTPMPGEGYETIVISLQEDLLRQLALKEQIAMPNKYAGPSNIIIEANDFLRGFFQSIIPYTRMSSEKISPAMGVLKVNEAVNLILQAMPGLAGFLFDFSEPHKIDLEKFMLSNYHFNVPVQKFAKLTGRSLAAFKRDFQKTFGMAPRQWLQEKRLAEAKHLIEKKNQKPSAIYLDLGFESLSHFSHSFKKKFGRTPTELLS